MVVVRQALQDRKWAGREAQMDRLQAALAAVEVRGDCALVAEAVQVVEVGHGDDGRGGLGVA